MVLHKPTQSHLIVKQTDARLREESGICRFVYCCRARLHTALRVAFCCVLQPVAEQTLNDHDIAPAAVKTGVPLIGADFAEADGGEQPPAGVVLRENA